MASIKTAYANSAAITITLNSLGSGNSRESTVIDNSSNLYLDALVTVVVNVGTVSGDKAVYVYAYASEDGTVLTDNATGSDAAITLESPTCMTLVAVIPTPTSSKAYEKIFSLAQAFGGVMPRKWGLAVNNGTGASLAASGNSASYSGVTATVA